MLRAYKTCQLRSNACSGSRHHPTGTPYVLAAQSYRDHLPFAAAPDAPAAVVQQQKLAIT
jgi:hypothetical protein